jgi:hypothetical protein
VDGAMVGAGSLWPKILPLAYAHLTIACILHVLIILFLGKMFINFEGSDFVSNFYQRTF